MYRTVSFEIKKNTELYAYLEELCTNAKNLYNTTNFYIRQVMTGIQKEDIDRQPNEKDVLSKIEEFLPLVNKIKENRKSQTRYEMPTKDKWMLTYNLLDGIFEVASFEKLKSICKDDIQVKNNYINAYEEFIEDKKRGIPFLYYFKSYVDSYEQEQKISTKVFNFKSGILTPESVFENIKDSVSLYAKLLYSSKNEKNSSIYNQKAIEIINNLDNMVLKLKAIKEPKRTECLIFIRDMWIDENKYLYEKIENTFNVINMLYDVATISKKNKM